MRALALPLFAFLASIAAAFAAESGRPAPDFAFADLAGQSHRLADYRGRIVVLEWLNPACPYVLRHYKSGNLPALQARAATDGVVWLQINSNAMGDLDARTTREWQKKQDVVASAFIRDTTGTIGRLYGAQKTPHLFVIARDGTLAYQGALDDQPNGSVATVSTAQNYIQAALAALQAGHPMSPAATEPYGCAVKY